MRCCQFMVWFYHTFEQLAVQPQTSDGAAAAYATFGKPVFAPYNPAVPGSAKPQPLAATCIPSTSNVLLPASLTTRPGPALSLHWEFGTLGLTSCGRQVGALLPLA